MTTAARSPWWQRSLRARIVVLFLGMLLGVQLASFLALRASLSEHAHRVLPERLREGEHLLQSLLDRRAQTLLDGAHLLAADYGFREAVGSNDDETIVSVLANHGARIGATEVALLGTDFRLRASTASQRGDLAPLLSSLAAQASAAGQGSAIALLGARAYQAVLVPMKAPVVVGWVLMAFPIDARLSEDMRRLSALDITLLVRATPSDAWSIGLTSLDGAHAQALAARPWRDADRDVPMASVDVRGEELGVRVRRLGNATEAGVVAVVSLSIDEAVRLPRDLQLALVGITLVGIAVFAIGSVFTARRVSTPLRDLAGAAERLGAGDYATPMRDLQRHDEVGQLSQSFERMRTRIAENQEQILKLAYWDGLTGLPNRARFREAVNQAVEKARGGGAVAVLLLDLDRFKHVNEVLGYRVGDQLLVQVAERLSRRLVREGDMVARLSADEFGILLPDADEPMAQAVARRIEEGFATPLALEGHHVDMGAGIGFACWPTHADDGESLLKRAEVAMHAAKRRGNGFVAYHAAIDVASVQTLSLMTELRQAVERGELRLALQPKLSLRSGKVVGAEALVRWQHPQRGLVPPMQFIPFAEQTGFIRVLTMWVFEEALVQWQALHLRGLDLLLSVNLSTRDLLDAELPQKFQALLARHRVPARALCLEITESAVMDDPQRALAVLNGLAAAGLRLSIDDFGTGYSSLAYLKRLPVDELKIDQSFVRNMENDASDAMIVRSTIDLAHNLGIHVVAEGVENERVWEMLRDLRCDQAQGYHMGRPMPPCEFPAWAARWSAGQAADDHRPTLH
jgi:diguanylate cyclase (GGDEF)-like protein